MRCIVNVRVCMGASCGCGLMGECMSVCECVNEFFIDRIITKVACIRRNLRLIESSSAFDWSLHIMDGLGLSPFAFEHDWPTILKT